MIKSVHLSRTTALLAVGALVALAPFARAQQDSKADTKPEQPAATQRPRRPAPSNVDAIAEKLKLTDDQKKQLQPILRDEAAKLRDLRQDTSLSNEERREKAKSIRDQSLAKIKPVLSEDQFDQY